MYILFMYSVSQTICCFLCLSHLHIQHVLSIVVVGVGGHQVAAFGRVQVLASVPGLPPAGLGCGRTTNCQFATLSGVCPSSSWRAVHQGASSRVGALLLD